MTTYLIHREMSPLRQTDKYFSPRFFRIRENEEKNTCQKNYWAVRTPPLYFDKMSKKKELKERKKNSQTEFMNFDWYEKNENVF